MVNVKEYPLYFFSYSMEIKEQTRKLTAGCSKHCFEVVDRTDEVSNHTAQNTVLRLQIELTKSVTYLRQGEADLV
ncbi:hypothetical protein [Streptococcus pneumoniae]|uniref:hypothetical protein n=1 Tax=Streptococcus pneumoniae TaxID=1313 RepID=UPI001CD2F048|nr:hypothetical protein [Streptococcus pneumoniae]